MLPIINISHTGGVAAGPPLGGFLYWVLGYSGPFFILGGLVLLYGTIVLPCLGFQFESMIKSGEEHEEHLSREITFKDFLKNGVSLSFSLANTRLSDWGLCWDVHYHFLRTNSRR